MTKLNSEGNDLVYSTFIGGKDSELLGGTAIDDTGCVYATGYTTTYDYSGSPDFPVTTGAFDESFNGIVDAFVLKLLCEAVVPGK